MLCINLEDQCATVLGSYIQFYTPANSFPSFIKQGFFFVLAHSPATQRYFFRLLQWFSFSCGYCWMHDYLRLSFHMSLLYHLLLQPRVLSKVVFQTHKLVSCCVFKVLHQLCISAACDHGVWPCLSAQHLHNAYRWAWNDDDLFYFHAFVFSSSYLVHYFAEKIVICECISCLDFLRLLLPAFSLKTSSPLLLKHANVFCSTFSYLLLLPLNSHEQIETWNSAQR